MVFFSPAFFPDSIGRRLQLLQASSHRGLQVQNLSGEWIDAPPIPGTFVVNIGKGNLWTSMKCRLSYNPRITALEFITRGLARATSHRVLSPKGSTPRYSVPFFQNIGLDIRLSEHVLECEPHTDFFCHSPCSLLCSPTPHS